MPLDRAKNKQLFIVEASTLYEFKEKILAFRRKSPKSVADVGLVMGENSVLTMPFKLEGVDPKDIAQLLRFECADLLGVSETDIVLDHQILDRANGHTSGIYIGARNKDVQDYLNMALAHDLEVNFMSTKFLLCLDEFLSREELKSERFCLLDVSGAGKMQMAVFYHEHCELLRSFPFESIEQAVSEIVQAVRSCCSKSKLKTIGRIFIRGEENLATRLQPMIASHCGPETQVTIFREKGEAMVSAPQGVLRLNLARSFVSVIKSSARIRQGVNIGIGVCLVLVVFLGFQMILKQKNINHLKSGIQQEK